ncbi:hypothetical protein PIB30_062675 [Stylosanthes scabra]|uniref:Uncharacterized protein n=1 Tax=Stylosanthes scabra TaxID=79078 RepID=A0ABU6ULR6_9FABA|nr:hypothetical protein [Stylosanthes scabra]
MLSVNERELYGWVDDEVFSQSSVVTSNMLLELRREMRLTEERVSEKDYVTEAADPSDRLPSQAAKDRTHFLWVYTELFTRLGVRLPFTDFQREVMTRCRVAASQLHLNGWGFLRTFEHVSLHFGFHPSWHVFLYIYQLQAPPSGKGFMSFLAHQGRRLFDAFEESIQEFKWHYFKVLPFLGRHPFWLDDEGKPFPWVYWILWRLWHSLLGNMEKQSRLDRLRQNMMEVEGVGPRSIVPSLKVLTAAAGASASTPVATAPQGSSSDAAKTKKKPPVASSDNPISVEKEEGAKEDPSADLKQKRRKQKVYESFPEEATLGADSA